MSIPPEQTSDRRGFLTKVAAGSAAIAASGVALNMMAPASAYAESATTFKSPPGEEWLDKITGKHRQFFDGVTVNDGFAFGYALNYLNANNSAYQLPDSSLTAVVGLRHFASTLAFTDAIWSKYKLGEFLKLTDPGTKQPLTRNMYYRPHDGELMLPEMSIDNLMKRGAIVTVCNVALSLFATMTSKGAGVTPEVAKQEWTAGVIPGVHIVPAGVLAVNRAQEKGCTYCSAG